MISRYDMQTLVDGKSTHGISISVVGTYNEKYHYESLLFRIRYLDKIGVDFEVINDNQLDHDRLTLILDSAINRLLKEKEE